MGNYIFKTNPTSILPLVRGGAKSPPALFKKREPICVYLCPSVVNFSVCSAPYFFLKQ